MSFKNVDIKRVRDYWDSRPCNLRHSVKEIGTREYFDEIEFRKYYVEPHILYFTKFQDWRDKKVLEIGCGIGTDSINFARVGSDVTAIDLSEESLKIARKRVEVYGYNNVKFYNANCEELSKTVPVKKYDLVYSFGALHHTPNPERAIEEIKKYMDQNSILKIMLYNKYSWKSLWVLVKYGRFKFWKFSELMAKYSEAQTGCPVTYLYTKNSIRKLLKDFDILSIKKEHIFSYKIEDYKEYRYKKVWYFRIMPIFLFKFLERLIGWHLCIEAMLKPNYSNKL